MPLAVAWDAGQAGKNFADGNVFGGVLSLGAAAGVGLAGLDAVAQAGSVSGAGSFAADAGKMAYSIAGTLGFTDTAATATTAAVSAAQAAGHVGAEVLEGTALLGGLSGVAQSAAHGDPLGIAAGVLEAASAVAGGLVTTEKLSGAAADFARKVSVGAGLASVGASSADAFAHGDLAGGLLSSLNALLTQVAHEVLDPPATAKPPGTASGTAAPGGGVDEPPTTAPAGSAGGSGTGPFDGPGMGGATDPANPNPILSDSDGPTRTLPDGTPITPAGYAAAGGAGMVEVAASALEALAATPAGRAALAAAEVVLGPEVAAAVAVGGTVYLGVKAVQVLLDYNVLPSGPASQTNVAGYDGTVLGRQSLGVEVNPQAGTGVLYNALGPGGGPLADGRGAPLSYDAATGTLTGADGTVVGRYADGRMTPAPGVDLPALVRSSPLIAAPPSVLGNGVLADPIPPPVPPGPPPLVPPQVDSPPEAFVPPPVPGQAGDEGLTILPPVPSNLPGMPVDGPQGPTIFAASSFGNMDLPRTPGLGSSASMGELVAQDAVPAKDGVVITDPVKDPSELFPDMYRLSQATGAEYALVRRPDGALVLYSGAPNVVRSPMEYEPITHTHPDSSEPLPSLQDIQVLNDVWMENPTLPRPNSTIVWGSGPNESTPYHPTGLDDLSSPK